MRCDPRRESLPLTLPAFKHRKESSPQGICHEHAVIIVEQQHAYRQVFYQVFQALLLFRQHGFQALDRRSCLVGECAQ